jgi:hypothetical protein
MSDNHQPKRKYIILYRRGNNPFGLLTPNIHEKLYNRPEVAFGVAFIQANEFIEGVCIRLEDELYNIMITLDAKNPHAFEFSEKT